MRNLRLLETIADIAYTFGANGYFSGNSREDILEIIFFAKEFERQKHDWDKEDYISLIHDFSILKLEELKLLN
jgi:hypothetical protein